MCSWTSPSSFWNTDAREGMQEEEEHQAAPPIGSLEAVVEEQAAAEGAARQARVCFYPVLNPGYTEWLTHSPQPCSSPFTWA